MSIENLFSCSIDSRIINHYLQLLTTRQVELENQVVQLKTELKRVNTELKQLQQPKIIEKRIAQFIVRSNGTALDTTTELTWCCYSIGQRWENGKVVGEARKMTWNEAIQIAGSFNKGIMCGGFNDWRLPTRYELQGIVEKGTPTINPTVFPMTQENWYWTSSPSSDSNRAHYVSFYTSIGSPSGCHKDRYNYVRLVR